MSPQKFEINMYSDQEHGATRMSCQNANCEQERNGWMVVLDPENAKHRAAADFIVNDSGRRYLKVASEQALDAIAKVGDQLDVVDLEEVRAVVRRTPPGMLIFVFSRHQQCFRSHLDREVEFVHATPRSRYVHANPKDFEEDMDESADAVGVLAQRG